MPTQPDQILKLELQDTSGIEIWSVSPRHLKKLATKDRLLGFIGILESRVETSEH